MGSVIIPAFCTGCPPAQALPLFLDYAQLEEQYGLAKHAMEVYERAVRGVPKQQRLQVVDIYLARATDFFGIAKVGGVCGWGGGVQEGGGYCKMCQSGGSGRMLHEIGPEICLARLNALWHLGIESGQVYQKQGCGAGKGSF